MIDDVVLYGHDQPPQALAVSSGSRPENQTQTGIVTTNQQRIYRSHGHCGVLGIKKESEQGLAFASQISQPGKALPKLNPLLILGPGAVLVYIKMVSSQHLRE